MNETTASNTTRITHRLKRLIGSSYHRKQIDIIITDNAPYVRNEGEWKSSDTPQEMIVFAHTKVIRSSRDTVNPESYSESEPQTLAKEHGITGDISAPCVSVMNGDWNTTGIWINGVMRQNNSIVLNPSSRLNANIPLRVNSLIGFAR